MAALNAPAPRDGEGGWRAPAVAIWAPLQIRDFRLVWTGEAISLLGDEFYFVALTWLTLQLTGSGLALGTMFAVAAVPRGALMLVGGALTDRWTPRALMLVSNAIRACVVASIALLVALHAVQLWHLYVLAVIFGTIDAFFYPASSSIVPSLVDDAHLTAGTALMQGTMQAATLMGPALAGAVIAWAGSGTGVGVAFGFDAVSFAVATATLVRLRQTTSADLPAPDVGDRGSIVSSITAGLRYAWHDPIIRPLLFAIAAIDFSFAGPFTVGLATLAHGRLAGGAAGFGAMLAAWGAGAMTGTVAGGSLGRPRRRGLIMIPLVAVLGIGMTLLAFVPTVFVAASLVAAMGLGSGFINALMLPWLQTRVAPSMLGRVMSLIMLASFGLAPVSFAVAGALSKANAELLFGSAGALVLLATIGMAASRPLRGID